MCSSFYIRKIRKTNTSVGFGGLGGVEDIVFRV